MVMESGRRCRGGRRGGDGLYVLLSSRSRIDSSRNAGMVARSWACMQSTSSVNAVWTAAASEWCAGAATSPRSASCFIMCSSSDALPIQKERAPGLSRLSWGRGARTGGGQRGDGRSEEAKFLFSISVVFSRLKTTDRDRPRPTATDRDRPRPTATDRDRPRPRPTATDRDRPRPTATDRDRPRPTATDRDRPRPTATDRDRPRPTATDRDRPRPTATDRDRPRPTATDELTNGRTYERTDRLTECRLTVIVWCSMWTTLLTSESTQRGRSAGWSVAARPSRYRSAMYRL